MYVSTGTLYASDSTASLTCPSLICCSTHLASCHVLLMPARSKPHKRTSCDRRRAHSVSARFCGLTLHCLTFLAPTDLPIVFCILSRPEHLTPRVVAAYSCHRQRDSVHSPVAMSVKAFKVPVAACGRCRCCSESGRGAGCARGRDSACPKILSRAALVPDLAGLADMPLQSHAQQLHSPAPVHAARSHSATTPLTGYTKPSNSSTVDLCHFLNARRASETQKRTVDYTFTL